MQKYNGMVCAICKKGNPAKHQDFCRDLNCSGAMVDSNNSQHKGIRIDFTMELFIMGKR